ncbi:hypothetical protein B0H13DRAFT_2361505 [Mycena leptocephala]|nr:hypothetical protein B0H13DRAFT_2361505 [Mycena leptocephala]
MRFNFLSIASAFTTTVFAQANSCPEAARFGLLKTFSHRQPHLCNSTRLLNTPTFLDYYIDAVATHTVSGPILIARRTFLPIASAFTTTVLAQANFCPEGRGCTLRAPQGLAHETFSRKNLHPHRQPDLCNPTRLLNTPAFLDYYIDAVVTHTFSGPILLARRTYHNSTIDQFTAVLPNWFYFADAPRQYELMMDNSFVRMGPTGESVVAVGGGGYLRGLISESPVKWRFAATVVES